MRTALLSLVLVACAVAQPLEMRGNEVAAGMLAMTFDDGPNPRTTPELLDLLDKHKVRATFFMLGKQVKAWPELARTVAQRGHVVAAHSMDHRKLTRLTEAQLAEQVAGSQKLIADTTGQTVTLFRAPYGSRDGALLRAIDMAKMRHVLWSIDSRDWADRNPPSVMKRVVDALTREPRGILLMHDIHPSTIAATRMILEAIEPLRASGHLKLVTVPELATSLAAAP